jgi:hypothetical protein
VVEPAVSRVVRASDAGRMLDPYENRQRLDLPVLVVDYPGVAPVATEMCATPPVHRGSATPTRWRPPSCSLAAPDVRMERAVAEYPGFRRRTHPPFRARGLSTSVVFGDARAATAEKGRPLLGRLVDGAIALVRAFLAAGPESGPNVRTTLSVSGVCHDAPRASVGEMRAARHAG